MKKITSITLLILFSIFLLTCKKKEKPVVETINVSNITSSSVDCEGNVISDAGDAITSRGICWSKNVNPTIEDNKTSDGASVGYFTSIITKLDPGTVYYIKAYATNSNGTGYGVAVAFKTLGEVPSASTAAPSGITTTTARLSASINPNYVSTIVTFEYGTTINYGNSVTAAQSPLTGNAIVPVTADLIALSPGVTYHYRVKAENSLGITYSSDLIFTTLGQAPSVTTPSGSNINTSSVTISSYVNPNYVAATVIFEYGTSTNYGYSVPAVQNTVTGNSNVYVNATISSLSPGTLYHIRVKAENSVGNTYSSDITITTLGHAPTVTTRPATQLLTTSTFLNGSVNANYISTTVKFEYGTSNTLGSVINADQNPVQGSTIVSVTAKLSGLTGTQTYYFRVKAENALGVSYGDILTFVPAAPPASVTDVEGNIYPVVQIGTQYWMGENLKTTKYNDNTDIPNVTNDAAWIALTSPAYCWYSNDASTYKNTYGALYNFYAVSTGKLCPTGWHVPSDAEFTVFTRALGDINYAGGKIKEAGFSHWTSPNTGATNETGFTALPAGYRTDAGTFSGSGLYEEWWTSTPYNEIKPWYRSVGYQTSAVEVRNGSLNQRGFSVRCIKD